MDAAKIKEIFDPQLAATLTQPQKNPDQKILYTIIILEKTVLEIQELTHFPKCLFLWQ